MRTGCAGWAPARKTDLVIATALVDGIPTVVSADDRLRKAIELLPGLRLVHLKAHLPI